MTEPDAKLKNSKSEPIYLSYQGSYSCPLCRRGKITALALMDAFGCNFCRHIFTVNLEKQILRMADSSLPISWQWNGRGWKRADGVAQELGWGIWIAAIAFIILPTAIIGMSAYLFPPLPGSPLSYFPYLWTVFTFLSHLSIIIWLTIEYYQLPVLTFIRVWQQQLERR